MIAVIWIFLWGYGGVICLQIYFKEIPTLKGSNVHMLPPKAVEKRDLFLFYKHATTFGVVDLSTFTNLNSKGKTKINLKMQFNFYLL